MSDKIKTPEKVKLTDSEITQHFINFWDKYGHDRTNSIISCSSSKSEFK